MRAKPLAGHHTGTAPGFAARLRAHSDGVRRAIVLMEQRGDHLAEPTLNCAELDAPNQVFDDPPNTGPAPQQADFTHLQACRERLIAQGVDLAAYSTAESGADLADLRRVLGYESWNLYGTSYGTRLALETMRNHPEGLRAVILDGLYPPNVNATESAAAGYSGAVRAMFDACAADQRCHARYPDSEHSLIELLQSMRQSPLALTAKHPHTRSPITTVVRDTDITAGLYAALHDANLVRALPFIIDELARGNLDVALPLAQQGIDYTDRFSEGLQTTINCAEDLPYVDESRRAASYSGDPLLPNQNLFPAYRESCAIWHVPAAPATSVEAVRSDIPTLLTSGGYDPVTPPANADVAARGLSRHYAHTFPAMGHGAVWSNWYDPCPASIAKQFLHDPNVAPDDRCIAATSPTKFLTTDDIRPTPAIYHLNSDVIQDRNPWQIALVSTTLVILFAGLVYGGVTLISPRGRLNAAGMVSAVALATAWPSLRFWLRRRCSRCGWSVAA